MKNSSQSIVKLLLVIIIFFLLLDFFFQGSRLMKWYMALLYEVMFELTRFTIHGFWSLGGEKYLVCLERKVENGSVSLDTFYHHMKIAENIGLFILIVLNISILYVIIRWIRKYQRICMQDIQRKGILFLMIFPAIGFAFDLVLRCLWITSKDIASKYMVN